MKKKPQKLNKTSLEIIRKVKRGVIFIIGISVLVFGVSLIVLPGPAIVVIPLGLAILGSEFIYAKQILNKIKKKIGIKEQK